MEGQARTSIQAAESLIPHLAWDSRKTSYLAYRATGHGAREAEELTGVIGKTVQRWRLTDVRFVELEESITRSASARNQFASEAVRADYMRNYRMVLEKDFSVIKATILSPGSLNHQDFQYLLKLRPHYTPQQLQAIEGLFSEGKEGIDFAQLVITLRKSRGLPALVEGQSERYPEPERCPVEEIADAATQN